MNRININFREPNVDRFIEIMATSNKFGMVHPFELKNMPIGYEKFVGSVCYGLLNQMVPDAFVRAGFSDEFSFDQLFREFEPPESIIKRINSAVEVKSPQINDVCKSLLKNAAQKLTLDKDQIQVILDLSCVIASLDKSDQIEAHHISEAIQYSIKY